MSTCSLLAVTGFIRQMYQNTIPNNVVQICFYFYFIPKQLFIRYHSGRQTQFGIINMNNMLVSKLLFHGNLSFNQRIANQSPYFIPNISKLLYNLSSDVRKSMKVDFKNTSYDALFCIIAETARLKLASKLCFILFQSKYLMHNCMNGNTAIDMKRMQGVLFISRNALSFQMKSIIHISAKHGIFCKSTDDNLYQLKFEHIKSDNFAFKKCNYTKYNNYVYSDFIMNNNLPEQFVKQELVSYKQTLDALLKNNCCVGVYDFDEQQWRTAVYIQHSDTKQEITVAYITSSVLFGTPRLVLKHFPVNFLQIHNKRFHVDENTLRQVSRVQQNRIYVLNLNDYQILFSEKLSGLESVMDWNGKFRFIQYCISEYC
eukprot:316193_1